MIICGLKLTHDGAIALIEKGTLIFSIEMEKINNNPRYTSILDTSIIESILEENGYSISDVDHFVIDGWGGNDQDSLAIQPRLEIGENNNFLEADNLGAPYKLGVGRYTEDIVKKDVLKEWKFDGLKIGKHNVSYSSFNHVTGHISSAYLTSPFAKKGESSYVLIWDGGMYPMLYFFDAEKMKVSCLGPLFLLIGNIYTIFSQHFGPFKVKGKFAKDDLSIAGKVMAYIALGEVKSELFEVFDTIIGSSYEKPMGFANIFTNKFIDAIEGQGYSDEDILCTFHAYLEKLLIDRLTKKMKRFDFGTKNICLAGGCALNIKWNSSIREDAFFDSVYVPPFPNDSGSAMGGALTKYLIQTDSMSFDWNVYSGPKVKASKSVKGWKQKECSLKDLADILNSKNEPVVFLNGRAELGPRALGNRSIIAAPNSKKMKDILNEVKKRERYRPVSPICLEEDAKSIFEPGIKDPFMLFDHMIRPEWKDKIPAVIHIDGSSRLQTVNKSDNAVIHELLTEYKKLSGIPMLCNTSANLNGSGFFPDVESVIKWDEVNYVWSDYVLYEKIEKIDFVKVEQSNSLTEA